VKLIVGLGNPGRAYAATRHNVGWWVLDQLAERWGCDAWKRDSSALVAGGRRAHHVVRLLKPQTYMNLSGNALVPYTRRSAWNPSDDLLVVVDDVALPIGRMRMRAGGSAGGHNGLRSIEAVLGTQAYPRLRIGIAPDQPVGIANDLADFVLGPFTRAERTELKPVIDRACDAVEIWVRDGITLAMNRANVRARPAEDPPSEPGATA
jgi:PTH1 family peptidyl-tRNA hydrolase